MIIFLLKKNLITISWVTNIAKAPKKGFIVYKISIDFFKFNYLFINNLYVCYFLLAIIGRLQDCPEKIILKLWLL